MQTIKQPFIIIFKRQGFWSILWIPTMTRTWLKKTWKRNKIWIRSLFVSKKLLLILNFINLYEDEGHYGFCCISLKVTFYTSLWAMMLVSVKIKAFTKKKTQSEMVNSFWWYKGRVLYGIKCPQLRPKGHPLKLFAQTIYCNNICSVFISS